LSSKTISMVKRPNNGTLIRKPKPSNQLANQTSPGISKALENQVTCKYIAPTPDGGNYSDTQTRTSAICKTRSALMYQEPKMLTAKMLLSTEDTTMQTKDGRSDMLIKLRSLRNQNVVKLHFAELLASMVIESSTLYQDSQCTDWLKLLVPKASHSRSTQRVVLHRYSISMLKTVPSYPNNGKIMHWMQLPVTAQHHNGVVKSVINYYHQASRQLGRNYSVTKMESFPTIKLKRSCKLHGMIKMYG